MLKRTTEWLKGGLEWEFVIVSHAPVFRGSKKQFHSLMLNGIFFACGYKLSYPVKQTIGRLCQRLCRLSCTGFLPDLTPAPVAGFLFSQEKTRFMSVYPAFYLPFSRSRQTGIFPVRRPIFCKEHSLRLFEGGKSCKKTEHQTTIIRITCPTLRISSQTEG